MEKVILLVDDDIEMHSALVRLGNTLGYDVAEAASGA